VKKKMANPTIVHAMLQPGKPTATDAANRQKIDTSCPARMRFRTRRNCRPRRTTWRAPKGARKQKIASGFQGSPAIGAAKVRLMYSAFTAATMARTTVIRRRERR
jgi:hypothetical protein